MPFIKSSDINKIFNSIKSHIKIDPTVDSDDGEKIKKGYKAVNYLFGESRVAGRSSKKSDLDKILTTMIVKDLSIGVSDSSYLFLVDEEGDTILSAGLFSELIFTSEDSISVIGIPEKIILDADNFSGRLEYQIIKM